MPLLTLSLFGPFTTTLDDQPLYSFRTNKVQALLIYLAVERDRPHPRETLMELLWPGMPLESAQVNLRQTVYRLRQAIPDVDSKQDGSLVPLLLSDRQSVQLNPQANLRLDVAEFLAGIEVDPTPTVELYRGDFLADFYLVDSSEFEAWAEGWREKLRRQVLVGLDQLTRGCLQNQEYAQAQAYAWRQLEIDPLRELAYRQLMQAFAGNGQRGAALSQFQILQRRLKEELDIEPSPESVRLYEQIQAEAQRQVKAVDTPRSTSSRPMPVFMLTDIENSTRLWDTHRQAMLGALLHHNSILEEQINQHGGRILELRGDGVKAVFENANPLPCVLAIQIAFGEADWGEIGALKIRIGLHGVPPVRKDSEYFLEDDKYYGPVLNHTARIMDAGWGGQILVSEQVQHAFALPPGASWHDYGLHSLKSLEQPVHIYGLVHPDLPQQSFPPLRSSSNQVPPKLDQPVKSTRPRHNLTAQPSAFVGRQNELADLEALLADSKSRLITILGPGGMGKTRLALALAEGQVRILPQSNFRFPDGVFFVPLASLNQPEQIISAIAKALNLPMDVSQSNENREIASQTISNQKEILTGYLDKKRMLLVMDNFEHLLEGVTLVSELLEAAPNLQIVATSRERLQMREEQVYPIHGLEFPEWEAPDDPCKYTAMELFLQSAHKLQPDFELDADDFVYLTRICRLVGGMPLGLELAASWVDILSVAEIATEIQNSLDFLETDIRNMPDRHRSMRAVFDSSWKRLNESEQQVFARLAILRGTFPRTAAEEVAQANLRTLANLVNKSLLQYDQTSNRYQIHELLRQYGAEQLAATPEDELRTWRRFSRFYCARVEEYFHLLMAGQIQVSVDLQGLDIANIRSAWDWSIENTEFANVYQALDGICLYFDWSWRVDEALTLCQTVSDLVLEQGLGKSSDPVLTKRLHAKALGWQGYFNLYYDHQRAIHLLKQSEIIVEQLLKQDIKAYEEEFLTLYYLGWANSLSGDQKIAKDCLTSALEVSQKTGLEWMHLRALMMLGNVARNAGAPSEAKYWYGQCLTVAQAQDNRWGEISALNDLGWAARSLISYQEAQTYYEESLALAKTCRNQWEVVNALESLGYLSIFLGRFEKAFDFFSQSVAITKDLGMPYRALPCQIHMGVTKWLLGEFSQAEVALRDSIILTQDSNPAARVFPIICYAEYLTIMGRYREADAQIRRVTSLVEGIFVDRFTAGRLLRVHGYLSMAEKKYAEARLQFQKSIELYQQNSDDEQVAWSQAGLAAVAIHQGDWEEAYQLLTEALWTCIEIQGFIPLLFTLPIVSLYFANQDSERARFVYAQIQYAPFPARANLFKDVAYDHLPEAVRDISAFEDIIPADFDLRQRLWTTASEVLSSWIQVWMEEPELKQNSKPT